MQIRDQDIQIWADSFSEEEPLKHALLELLVARKSARKSIELPALEGWRSPEAVRAQGAYRFLIIKILEENDIEVTHAQTNRQ